MSAPSILFRADLKTLWLLGQPVSHSLSPLIQNTALQRLGLPIIYQAAAVSSEGFVSAVRGLSALGALGANVTVPHKQAAYRLCDQLSPRAKAIGACNVLIFRDGEIRGDNTDGAGWWRGLSEQFPDRLYNRAVVLGAGGAARAVVARLVESGVDELFLLNRTVARAQALVEALIPTATAGPLERFAELLQPGCLVVQTTSAGLCAHSSPLPLPERWPEGAVLSELIYGEKTALASAVENLGGEVQDGLAMLVYQAAESLALWLELPPEQIPVKEMMAAAMRRLSEARSER